LNRYYDKALLYLICGEGQGVGNLLLARKRSEGVKCNYLGGRNQGKKKEKNCCNIAYHFVIEELQRKEVWDWRSGKFRTLVLVLTQLRSYTKVSQETLTL